jgi:hypothetical protein
MSKPSKMSASLALGLLFFVGNLTAAESLPPYPPSPVITKLTWAPEVIKCGKGRTGDNWPITWVNDNLQITCWGDGPGFVEKNSAASPKLSLGLAMVSGDPPDFQGKNFATDADTPAGGGPNAIKASALLMVDGVLYMFVRNYKPPGSDDFTNSRLAWSKDKGVHWSWADWHFTDTFGCPEFVQFGKNYQGARDNYVYIASQANDSAYNYSPDIVMARVPKDKIADRSRYEFFDGLNAGSEPTWSPDIEKRKPIFTDPSGTQRIAITYNAPLDRFILTTSHRPQGNTGTHTAALGVFDAPLPWGPWTTVYYDDHWSVIEGKDCRTYHHKFPTKWMSSDGKTMWLLFSGDDSFYAFCVKKATLEISPSANRSKESGAKSEAEQALSGGLASKYKGDKGIENDPDVIFAENFDEGSMDAVKSRWESVKDIEIMSLSKDVPQASAGKHSLLMTHIGGKGTGGHLYRRLLPGYDQLYIRFYVKFDTDCAPIHHFVHVGGYNPPTPWPQGGAGNRPVGNERFTTGVEPYAEKWRWDFYSYWMGMRSSPDSASWGHDFINDDGLKAQRGKWICVELMMKMNSPVTDKNGEQSLWIDGKLWSKDGQVISRLGKGFPKGKWVWDSFIPDPKGQPFEGFQWRNTEDLKLNFLWLLLYTTKAPPGHISKIWFDDIVVAKKYVGPINPSEN